MCVAQVCMQNWISLDKIVRGNLVCIPALRFVSYYITFAKFIFLGTNVPYSHRCTFTLIFS